MENKKLEKRIEFILGADRLKDVTRRNYLSDGKRREKTAEHSWYVALMAMVLEDHANNKDMDINRVIRMLLLHDLVEIFAGDTFLYDDKAHEKKTEAEKAAAVKIFGLLPEEQGRRFRKLWEEFESKKTPEAKFCASLDRLAPILLNYESKGKLWKEADLVKSQVQGYNEHMAEGSEELWEFAKKRIKKAVEKGYLKDE